MSLQIVPAPTASARTGATIAVAAFGDEGAKAAKLAAWIAGAARDGVTHVLTIGAAGSHHLYACAQLGRRAGLGVVAAVVPRPRSDDAERFARATAAAATCLPARSEAHGLGLLWGWRRRAGAAARTRFLAPGGTTPETTRALADALGEPRWPGAADGPAVWPDVVCCAWGSGGLGAAWCLALTRHGAPTRVLAVRAYSRWAVGLPRAASLVGVRALRRLELDSAFLGPGYGVATDAAREAAAIFGADGLSFEGTYTAKAAAAALARARAGERWLLCNAAPTRSPAPLDAPWPDALNALLR